LAWVRHELRELGIPPLKRFGQHFLLSRQIRDTLVDQAQLSTADTVVEVGAGLGFVTGALAPRAGKVIVLEKDRTLAANLMKRFANCVNVQVVQGDALKFPFPPNAKIVSSPPYNISSKLVLRILASHFKMASLLLQEDFIRRLTAKNGSRDYGRLTVMLQTRARAEYVSYVPKSSFYPQPRVDSGIAKIIPDLRMETPRNWGIFEDLVRSLFTQRRRKAHRVLSRYMDTKYRPEKAAVLSRSSLDSRRVYELAPTEFVSLSNLIADSINK
jgi:16S rRNA (adenine1518-N6/adenine1519-N6)-dimethyltransferase